MRTDNRLSTDTRPLAAQDGALVTRNEPGDKRWLQRILREELSDDDVRVIVRRTIEKAKNGCRFSRAFLFDYGMGRPRPIPEAAAPISPIAAMLAAWLEASAMARPLPEIAEAGDPVVDGEYVADEG